ncbi:MAG: AraC family transcriptional regulator [Reyranella sp.]|nr:AraC family transcriptional regulator [Reyranella sp.]
MPDAPSPFSTSVFPIDVPRLATHANEVTCILVGRRGAVSVESGGRRITGDVLLVQSGVAHAVRCAEGGAKVLFLDGLAWSAGNGLAERLDGTMAQAAMGAIARNHDAQAELRARIAHGSPVWSGACAKAMAAVLRDLATNPMERMTQTDLAGRLGLERTRALRAFKTYTGQTFRGFKRWTGLQVAARKMVLGESVGAAALDAGFADTAHLSRTFRHLFGLTPSEAVAGLARAARYEVPGA